MTPKEEVYRKLRQWQKALSLTDSDTGLISTGSSASRLQPKPNQNDLKLYEQVLERMMAEAAERQAPLRESDRHELEALQQVLQLPNEDVAEIEHRLDVQSAQSAQTVLPTGLPAGLSAGLPIGLPKSDGTPTSAPSSFNSPITIPSAEIPVTKIPATKIPAAEIPATEIPATKIPSAEIPSAEIPATEIPSSAGEVNQPANLTGVKGQMVKRKMDMDAASPSANPPPVDPASQKSVNLPVTETASSAAVTTVQPMDSAPASSTPTPAQVVVVEGSEKVQRDRRPLLITLGLLLPLLGLVGGIWFALRQWNTVPPDPKLARQFVESGNQKNQQRQYAAAIQDFDQAIRFNPQDATTFLNRGFAHHRMGRLNAAVDDYTKAVTLNKNFAEAYSNRSHARFDQRQQDAALKDAAQAIALQPNLAVAHLNLGNALFAQKNLDGAFQKFTKTLQLNPSNIVAARAHNNQGNVFANQKKIDEAIRAYTQAIQLDATYADALFNRAIAFDQKGNRQGAINDFREAANLYKAEGNNEMSATSTQRAEQVQKSPTSTPSTQSI